MVSIKSELIHYICLVIGALLLEANAQLRKCSDNPCKNGAKCMDQPSILYGYSCACVAPWTGINCDQPSVAPSPNQYGPNNFEGVNRNINPNMNVPNSMNLQNPNMLNSNMNLNLMNPNMNPNPMNVNGIPNVSNNVPSSYVTPPYLSGYTTTTSQQIFHQNKPRDGESQYRYPQTNTGYQPNSINNYPNNNNWNQNSNNQWNNKNPSQYNQPNQPNQQWNSNQNYPLNTNQNSQYNANYNNQWNQQNQNYPPLNQNQWNTNQNAPWHPTPSNAWNPTSYGPWNQNQLNMNNNWNTNYPYQNPSYPNRTPPYYPGSGNGNINLMSGTCSQQLCRNGATCNQSGYNTYYCLCLHDNYGPNCENSHSADRKSYLLAVVLGTILPFFALLIIGSVVGYFCCLKRKNNKDKQPPRPKNFFNQRK